MNGILYGTFALVILLKMTLATVYDRSTFRDCLKKLQWCIVLGGTIDKKGASKTIFNHCDLGVW